MLNPLCVPPRKPPRPSALKKQKTRTMYGLQKQQIKSEFLPTQSPQSYPQPADTIPATYPSYFHLYPSNLYH